MQLFSKIANPTLSVEKRFQINYVKEMKGKERKIEEFKCERRVLVLTANFSLWFCINFVGTKVWFLLFSPNRPASKELLTKHIIVKIGEKL